MKTKSKIITILIIVVMIVAYTIFYLCTAIKSDVDKVILTEYPTIEITKEEVNQLNSNITEKLEDSIFTDLWEIQKTKDGNYGNIFKINIHFQISRYVPLNDYIIGFNVDYSALDVSEKIFFSDTLGWTEDQYLFRANGGDEPAPTYVCLYGCTYGKDKEEIYNIAKKLKITLSTQDKLGNIKRKKINFNDVSLSVAEADENENASMIKLFE